MPVSITVRNVPEETRNELAARAARSGRSLQEYLRAHFIEIAERPDIETWLAQVRKHKREMGGGIDLSTETILRYRDEGRR
jgi:plasmid stability protein